MSERRKSFGAYRAAAVMVAMMLCCAPRLALAQALLELEVKASYLYKLAPYVAWPPDSGVTFNICVVGADPFGAMLDHAVAGADVARRPVVIRRLTAVSRDSPCQIAFLGGSSAQSAKDAERLLRGAPILTVTDAAAAPGIVDFEVVGGRVRFQIDDQAASEAGLSFSSKLLSLALSVKPRTTQALGQ